MLTGLVLTGSSPGEDQRKENGMANIIDMLDELQNRALREPDVREKLLSTKSERDPLSAFCRVCRELGYGILSARSAGCAGSLGMRSMRWSSCARERSFTRR